MTLRRDFLAATAGAAVAKAVLPVAAKAAPAAHTDAELIRLCSELHTLSTEAARLARLPQHTPGRWQAISDNDDIWQPKMAEAAAIPAVTLAGLRARTLALGDYLMTDLREACGGWADEPVAAMLRAFLGDVTGQGGDDAPAVSEAATVDAYAALEFGDEGPEIEQAIGDGAGWLSTAGGHWPTVRLAVAAMRRDDAETCDIVAVVGEDCATKFLAALVDVGNFYSALGEILHAAQVRTVAGMARHAVKTGQIGFYHTALGAAVAGGPATA